MKACLDKFLCQCPYPGKVLKVLLGYQQKATLYVQTRAWAPSLNKAIQIPPATQGIILIVDTFEDHS